MLRWLLSGMTRVSAFTVHEPPEAGGAKLERAENLVFVEDGFSWRAALFSPVYLLVKGEWLALAVYIAAAVVLSLVLQLLGSEPDWFAWMFVILNIITGFEMREFRRWSLRRAGWREIATVSGRGQEEAERRFFEDWLPTVSADAQASGIVPSRPPDFEARVEEAVQRLAARLRAKFLPNS